MPFDLVADLLIVQAAMACTYLVVGKVAARGGLEAGGLA